MHKVVAALSLFGLFALGIMGGPQTGGDQAAEPHATGLIPPDARELGEIAANWPRITRVGLNRLGFDRVNEVRSAKGKPSLDPRSVAPIGAEVESAVAARSASVQGAAANETVAGDLPVRVDNSLLRFFPPIRNQGSLGSCASFVSTYVQLSYMTAFQRNLDIRDPGNNTNKYSPKWSYDMLNDGTNDGSSLYQNYALLNRHGAATWAEFPYDTNYLAWCLDPAVWRNALGVRTRALQYIRDVSTATGIELTKELLTDGYVVVFGTYITSWVFKPAGDDASTADDDAAAGLPVAYCLNGSEGSHAMTIVGYNDAVWTDINGNGLIDTGEKGAFRIANTWGTGWYEKGFTWLAYDALRPVSAVPEGPSSGRVAAVQSDMLYVLTARTSYTPLMTAEFTLSHAKRNQLRLTLGLSSASSSTPTVTWTPSALQSSGGAFAFDGSTVPVSATFVLDFTDIVVQGGGLQRFYLGVNDTATGDPATLSDFKIVDWTTDPDSEAASSDVPKTADNGQVYSYVEYAYSGPAHNDPPQLASPQVNPGSGTAGNTFTFSVRYSDADGDVPTVKNLVLDGSAQPMTLLSGQPGDGYYSAGAAPGPGGHSYAFYFEDGHGESATAPPAGAYSGPVVYGHLLTSLSPWSAAAGDPALVLVVSGSDLMSGAVVTWNGADRPTTFVSSSRLEAAIPAADLAVGKEVPIVVRSPSGVLSNVLTFAVVNPQPSMGSLDPSWTTGGGSSLTLNVHGSGFVPSSAVRWNGTKRTTTYISPTEVRTSLSLQDLAVGGQFEVAVVNPYPGGGVSGIYPFSISDFAVYPSPSISTVVAGMTASYTVKVRPQNGPFDAAVSLSCAGLPRGCTATFSPATVTPGQFDATTTLTLVTRSGNGALGASAFSGGVSIPPFLGLVTALALLTALAAGSRRKSPDGPALRRLALAGLILIALWSAGCGAGGGGSADTTTPSGSFDVQIQAKSGSMTVWEHVTLVVQ